MALIAEDGRPHTAQATAPQSAKVDFVPFQPRLQPPGGDDRLVYALITR